MRPLVMLLFFCLIAACSGDDGYNVGAGASTPRYERPTDDPTTLGNAAVPVRVGELGPSFAACNARGQVRERATDRPIPVRAAPYDQARQVAQLPIGSDFFICTRSLDQRWLGVVFDRAGRASRSCNVSAPLGRRQDYPGPCASGWVASAQVQLAGAVDAVSGADDDVAQVVPVQNGAAPVNAMEGR